MRTELDKEIEAEFVHALSSRQEGNEGRARVCARRAAGIAARDFLTRHGVRSRNQYEALLTLAEFPGLPPEIQQSASHLTRRVTESFSLPVEVDLIAEARKICEHLSEI
jgi:hypothetical protein